MQINKGENKVLQLGEHNSRHHNMPSLQTSSPFLLFEQLYMQGVMLYGTGYTFGLFGVSCLNFVSSQLLVQLLEEVVNSSKHSCSLFTFHV